ncbi:hypothetical protein H4R34_004661 [Dimargaris verticillata]|uniref:Uncharacterized protein n=1 Tax=Dimargaris verticillata TaxID=2761393 RepID=A0A9W8EBZ9_9FUNG|nr:hypothetical protein H4R34_004661 [Dimargaris verticillata]
MTDHTVTFDRTWFTLLNLAMIAYASTLMVHISNLLVTTYLYRKRPRLPVFLFTWLQAIGAVSCHLSRMTDYFFTANCHVKGYYNYSCYLVSTSLLITIWMLRASQALPKATQYIWGGSALLIGTKVVGFVCLMHRFSSTAGKFFDCKTGPTPEGLYFMFGTELVVYAALTSFWAAVVGYRRSCQTVNQPTWHQALTADGAGYSLAIGSLGLILNLLVVTSVQTNVYVEIPLQIKWAVESALTVKQVMAYHRQLRDTELVTTDVTFDTYVNMHNFDPHQVLKWANPEACHMAIFPGPDITMVSTTRTLS